MAAGKLVLSYNKNQRLKKKRVFRIKRVKPNYSSIKNLSKKVNQITRSIEQKMNRVEGNTNLGGTGVSAADFSNQIWAVNPTLTNQDPKAIVISQGDAQGKRSGNQITTKKNTFSFVAILNPNAGTNTAPKPLYLKVWVVGVRGGQYGTTAPDVANLIKSRFFNTGDSYQGFNDTLFDLIRPINKDVFTIHYTKTFKLGNSEYWISSGGTPTNYQHYANNDFRASIKFTVPLTKYTQKNIRYNDDDGSIFNTTNWLFFTLHNIDGTTIGTNDPVSIYYDHKYYYTDI